MTSHGKAARVVLREQRGEPMRSAGELAQVEAAAAIVEQEAAEAPTIVVELEATELVDLPEQDLGEGEG